jgi:hypothetical protein
MDPAAHRNADDSVRYPSIKTVDEGPMQRRMYNYHVKRRLPYSDEKCSGIESSTFFKSTDTSFSSKILIISTLPEKAAL